jgi:hypothetical protein
MSEIIEIDKDSVTLTVVDNNITLDVQTSTVSLTTASVGPQGPQGLAGSNAQSFPVFSLQGQIAPYTGTNRFYFENAYTLTKIRASVGTAPTGSGIVVTAFINGSSVGTVTIPAGSNSGTTVVSSALVAGDYATISITSVGSIVAGSDLTVSLTIG